MRPCGSCEPSRHDGWGVVINQALGAGLPIITSDAVGAGLDLVAHGINGLHFTAGNAIELQSAMETFANCPNLISQWGNASRQKAYAMMPEEGAKNWVHVFRSLYGQNVTH